jgi:hypothetical protein
VLRFFPVGLTNTPALPETFLNEVGKPKSHWAEGSMELSISSCLGPREGDDGLGDQQRKFNKSISKPSRLITASHISHSVFPERPCPQIQIKIKTSLMPSQP